MLKKTLVLASLLFISLSTIILPASEVAMVEGALREIVGHAQMTPKMIYRKMARTYHTDKNSTPEAAVIFKALSFFGTMEEQEALSYSDAQAAYKKAKAADKQTTDSQSDKSDFEQSIYTTCEQELHNCADYYLSYQDAFLLLVSNTDLDIEGKVAVCKALASFKNDTPGNTETALVLPNKFDPKTTINVETALAFLAPFLPTSEQASADERDRLKKLVLAEHNESYASEIQIAQQELVIRRPIYDLFKLMAQSKIDAHLTVTQAVQVVIRTLPKNQSRSLCMFLASMDAELKTQLLNDDRERVYKIISTHISRQVARDISIASELVHQDVRDLTDESVLKAEIFLVLENFKLSSDIVPLKQAIIQKIILPIIQQESPMPPAHTSCVISLVKMLKNKTAEDLLKKFAYTVSLEDFRRYLVMPTKEDIQNSSQYLLYAQNIITPTVERIVLKQGLTAATKQNPDIKNAPRKLLFDELQKLFKNESMSSVRPKVEQQNLAAAEKLVARANLPIAHYFVPAGTNPAEAIPSFSSKALEERKSLAQSIKNTGIATTAGSSVASIAAVIGIIKITKKARLIKQQLDSHIKKAITEQKQANRFSEQLFLITPTEMTKYTKNKSPKIDKLVTQYSIDKEALINYYQLAQQLKKLTHQRNLLIVGAGLSLTALGLSADYLGYGHTQQKLIANEEALI